jgi:hypothetical protein
MNMIEGYSRRQAIRMVKECANAVIEQRERQAKGWDKGRYRDDDAHCLYTIKESIKANVDAAFALAEAHA